MKDGKEQFDGNFSSNYSNPRPFILRCSCTVQQSQRTLLRSVGRFSAGLLAPRTLWSHLYLQMDELEGLQLCGVSRSTLAFENWQNVRPQRMFSVYVSLNAGACIARIRTNFSTPGCKDDCEQSMIQTNVKSVCTKKLCRYTRNRSATRRR